MTFAEKYFAVFDADTGKIKTCGREACKTLMHACLELNPSGNFGDLQSGYMNVEAIKEMATKLNIIE